VSDATFFVTGGTMPRDALSYIERQADGQLLDGLRRGEFCYVLTSRQMGKSSLMVRTATRLRVEGTAVAVLDLTGLGYNLSVEQWYRGLLNRIGQHLEIEEEIDRFWMERADLSPLVRWVAGLQKVVLYWRSGKIVIFVDEIDVVKSLDFSADEFFVAIRSLYNRRAEEPDLQRITFCLLGVATPSDLIRDPRLTPFNIGRRIILNDFTPREAARLAGGLGSSGRGAALIGRALHWTNGHPYLTQKLCRALAESSGDVELNPQTVDSLCARLFLARRAWEQDDNLLFVREQLLRSSDDVAGLLGLYGSILRGRRAVDDDTCPLVTRLRLSGAVGTARGRLFVRNRIYARVFNRRWVEANMPGAEVLRLRTAYRRGLLRSSVAATIVVAAIGALALQAVISSQSARNFSARLARNLTEKNHLLYASNLALAGRAVQESDQVRAVQLLDSVHADSDRYEWRWLRAQCREFERVLPGHKEAVWSVVFSPDGRLVASSGYDPFVLIHDRNGHEYSRLPTRSAATLAAAFLPDCQSLITADYDGNIVLWDIDTRTTKWLFTAPGQMFNCLAVSPDGRRIAAGARDSRLYLLDAATGKSFTPAPLRCEPEVVGGAAFFPDGRRVVTASGDGTIRVWDVRSMRITRRYAAGSSVRGIAVMPDSKRILTADRRGDVRIWNASGSSERDSIVWRAGDGTRLNALAVSPDGRSFACAGSNRRIDVVSPAGTLQHRYVAPAGIHSLQYASDGIDIVSGGAQGNVQLWRAPAGPDAHTPVEPIIPYPDANPRPDLSPDGRRVVFVEGARVRIVDVESGKTLQRTPPEGADTWPYIARWHPDGEHIAVAFQSGNLGLWSVAEGRWVWRAQTDSKVISELVVPPDGKAIVTGAGDGTIRWNEAQTGSPLHRLATGGMIWHLSVSGPDGRIVFASLPAVTQVPAATRIGIADASSGTVLSSATLGSSEHITFIDWSLHLGQWVIGCAEGTIYFADKDMRRVESTEMREAHSLDSGAVSPDGLTLAVSTGGRSSGGVKLWDLRTQRELCTVSSAPTGAEWLRFDANGAALSCLDSKGAFFRWPAPPAPR
jgi:WD40 repeat protein